MQRINRMVYWVKKYFSHWLREYEVKKLLSPACCRLENAIFLPHIHATDGNQYFRPQYMSVLTLTHTEHDVVGFNYDLKLRRRPMLRNFKLGEMRWTLIEISFHGLGKKTSEPRTTPLLRTCGKALGSRTIVCILVLTFSKHSLPFHSFYQQLYQSFYGTGLSAR